MPIPATNTRCPATLTTVYDPAAPQIWRLPLRTQLSPAAVALTPRGGYIVPPAYAAEIGGKLALHGIKWNRVAQDRGKTAVEVFRAGEAKFAPGPFEGRTRVTLTGKWQREQQTIAAGSLFVPTSQPLTALPWHCSSPPPRIR